MNHLATFAALLAFLAAGLVGVTSPARLPLGPYELLKLPGVASVATYRMSTEPPTRRIVHLLNWHFVDQEAWEDDLRGQGASEEEIAESYPQHLGEVATVQVEKAKLLEALIDQHGVRAVYMEGLSAATVDQLQRQLELLRDYRPFVDPDTPLGQLLDAEHQRELLRVGPEGRLAMEGRLELLPAEDAAAYAAANPRVGDVVKFDEAAQERREDAVVQNLLAGPPVVVVVFGAGHNFYDNIRRAGQSIEYVRVRVKGWPRPAPAR